MISFFTHGKPSLHPWSEANLVMINDLFAMIMNLVCKYLIENVCISVYREGQSGPHRREMGILTVRPNMSPKIFLYPIHVDPGLGLTVKRLPW